MAFKVKYIIGDACCGKAPLESASGSKLLGDFVIL